jgi:hypothetical protein
MRGCEYGVACGCWYCGAYNAAGLTGGAKLVGGRFTTGGGLYGMFPGGEL